MRLITPLLIASTLAAGGMAFAGAQAGDKASRNARYAINALGEPQSCITRSNIRSTDVVDDQTIDFRMRNGDLYRNRLPLACTGLAFEEAFSYKTSTNQLCSVDIIRILSHSGGQLDTRGACGLGKFQKIEKIPKAEPEN